MTWDVDPADRANNHLIAASIGLHAWETVYVIHKGANYGYSEREGNRGAAGPRQHDGDAAGGRRDSGAHQRHRDERDHRADLSGDRSTRTPRTAATRLPADSSIAGKRCRRCRASTSLRDISTGRIWYADYKEMLAADDGNPATLAAMHDVHLQWEAPGRDPDAAGREYPTAFPVVLAAYKARGGIGSRPAGHSRRSLVPDARISALRVDAAGELYLLSKVDGMIRAVVAASR